MHLGLRLFFGFFVLAGLAAVFVLHFVLGEVKPSVREVMEDLMVDTAHLLAETAAPDLARLSSQAPGATLAGTPFAAAVEAYRQRPVQARIWGLERTTLDLRVYVTDAQGRVIFDSGAPAATGQDYSQWRDVARTLRGEYGARSSRGAAGDDSSTVMHVAAPVRDMQGRLLGVLAVAKPLATVQQFIDRAERRIAVAGAWLFGLALLVGAAVTGWAVASVRRLRRYAQQAGRFEPGSDAGVAGAPAPPVPALPGELGELARAMADMRERLDSRAAVEHTMRALTHELKSPLTAIRGAAELLQESEAGPPMGSADRGAFVQQIAEQAERARELVDRQLELAKLESLRGIERAAPVDLAALLRELQADWRPSFEQRGVRLVARVQQVQRVPKAPKASEGPEGLSEKHAPIWIDGDAAQLRLALSNLLANACDFSPAGSTVELTASRSGVAVTIELRDHGPGVPDYAWPQLGQRYFSTPRPRDGRRGSGLGLAIVRRVAQLHGGSLSFEPAQPGLRVALNLPAR